MNTNDITEEGTQIHHAVKFMVQLSKLIFSNKHTFYEILAFTQKTKCNN